MLGPQRFREANQYVIGLAESLRAQHPGKYVPTPLSLATLNWNALLICALIEAAILGVLWAMMPCPDPMSFLAQLAAAMLFGMGILAGTRVRGFWKRLLLLLPAMVVML